MTLNTAGANWAGCLVAEDSAALTAFLPVTAVGWTTAVEGLRIVKPRRFGQVTAPIPAHLIPTAGRSGAILTPLLVLLTIATRGVLL